MTRIRPRFRPFHFGVAAAAALALAVMAFLPGQNVSAQSQTFNSSGNWEAPAGVTQVDVACWGGGGSGGWRPASEGDEPTGGGGGGGYASATIAVTPGNNYAVTVGAGGDGVFGSTGAAGGDSFFADGSQIRARGGQPGSNSATTGGLGGGAVVGQANVGTTTFNGGNGGSAGGNAGGGGGGAAFVNANGNNGVAGSGNTGGAGGTGGPAGIEGDGGKGGADKHETSGDKNGPPGHGNAPGGGGGGKGKGKAVDFSDALRYIGDGAAGRCVLTWAATVEITFTKVVVGGDAEPSDWSFNVVGNNVDDIVDHDESLVLQIGEYTVTEDGPEGYAVTAASGACSLNEGVITLEVTADGETECIVTNTRLTGTIEVVKNLVPTNDAGLFNLQINGQTEEADAGHLGTTGAVTVPTGTNTVGETAGTGTSLANYTTLISCRDDDGAGQEIASSTNAGPLDVPVGAEDEIVCTITNTRLTGTIEVIKNLDPTDDAGLFNLQINGQTEEADAGHLGTTGAVTVPTGTNTVGETAGTGTSLTDYTTSISCRDDDGAGQEIASSTNAGPLNVTVLEDDVIVCTITNTRRDENGATGTIEVVKNLSPTNDAGRFNLQINGTTREANAGHNGTTGAVTVNTGTNTVGETAGTNTSLANYSTSISCRDDGGLGDEIASSDDAGPLNVIVNAEDIIVCTITNTRLDVNGPTGTIEVVKNLSPTNDPGRFNLQINGTTREANAGHNGTTGAVTVDTGTNTVSETAGTNTSLANYTTSISCRDNGGSGSVVASANNAGPLNVTVVENAVIVCTITNTRVANGGPGNGDDEEDIQTILLLLLQIQAQLTDIENTVANILNQNIDQTLINALIAALINNLDVNIDNSSLAQLLATLMNESTNVNTLAPVITIPISDLVDLNNQLRNINRNEIANEVAVRLDIDIENKIDVENEIDNEINNRNDIDNRINNENDNRLNNENKLINDNVNTNDNRNTQNQDQSNDQNVNVGTGDVKIR